MSTGTYEEIDKLDRRIVSALLINGRESIANISRTVGLSRTAVAERMTRLEKQGVITGYTAKLGNGEQTNTASCYLLLQCERGSKRTVAEDLQQIPEIKNISIVGGTYDLIVMVETTSLHSLHWVTDEIESIDQITKVTTSVVMHQPINRS
ncbi:Lrp/AsnC family transcriptional regulator [Vibrio sp. WXL103]|uniref:Lrp/AsnC family transcriptional regulator n=1 Tax=unclassified Vibrio TaxID=2614977 RepID=UPI003EC66025